ncbi:NAD(P)-dependent oxidoreductase [Gracilimonas mengyeensis]|uniref:Glutamate synthase (NADPH) small subunit n=1 Tax=Gracilimonas mengyeensis TaxID=1302730 RepID=A0A521CJM0_9BACT|nr:NAD(P)-dependent oxidoreductase [Gracilimonas mengyeensis]SMO59602.1 glutamate synthase (NADPH) small subunit [Gracilimonas mengyeensis]
MKPTPAGTTFMPTLNGHGTTDDKYRSLFRDLNPPLTNIGAVVEANRCLECGGPYNEAPCMQACPADIDVPGFISAIAEGNPEKAADIIYEQNILGGTCARVCPVETLCEGKCVLMKEGRKPVEIARLQRYATDQVSVEAVRKRSFDGTNGHKVAVIGAGPAGLSCAAELASKGYEVTVYDEHEDFGGLIRYAIAPYRINSHPIPKEVEMIKEMGVEFKMSTPVDTAEKLRRIEEENEAVFLGIGLGRDVDLHYEGENLPGVWNSLEFIEAIKTGHPIQVGQSVAVIGGGNTAIDVAREAKRLGGVEVTMYYRRTESEMPAYAHEVEEAREEGIHFQFLTNPIRFLGEDRLQRMELQYMKLGEPDDSGRPRPVKVPGTEFTVRADTVIKAIGQQKRTGFLDWIEGLDTDWGLIKTNPETRQTTNPKYFGGGDALNGGSTVVEAVRHGKQAAKGIHQYLGGAS